MNSKIKNAESNIKIQFYSELAKKIEKKAKEKNISFEELVAEYCNYAIEHLAKDEKTPS